MVSFTPLPLYSREGSLGTHLIGGWVSPKAVLDDVENGPLSQVEQHPKCNIRTD
jgi:hypothetical protein